MTKQKTELQKIYSKMDYQLIHQLKISYRKLVLRLAFLGKPALDKEILIIYKKLIIYKEPELKVYKVIAEMFCVSEGYIKRVCNDDKNVGRSKD